MRIYIHTGYFTLTLYGTPSVFKFISEMVGRGNATTAPEAPGVVIVDILLGALPGMN